MSHARRAVERALPRGLRLVACLEPSRIRARSGVEQSGRRAHEAGRARMIQTEEFRETKVCERIPTARASLRRGVGRVQREKTPYRGIIAKNCRRMDATARDL